MEQQSRRTRIVATLGPASRSPEMIARLIEAGVDVFRLNFSHGTQAEHGETIQRVRRASAEAGRPIAILQDLQGPKMRVGDFVNHQPVELVAGRTAAITIQPVVGTAERFSVTYEALPKDVRVGDMILLDDGRLQLRVTGVKDGDVIAEVVVGGTLSEHKGLNLPKTPLSAPSLTEKDRADLRFGVQAGVDFLGLSFVRHPEDIEEVNLATRAAGRAVPVIAKIERLEAVENLEKILDAADGVMVARGDLGVETSAAEVPLLQKRILSLAGRMGKPDITATQMLESMVSNPQPSRAEATDVANAVFDGTDAVMLSAETAMGRYPVEAVRMMGEIAALAEQHLAEYGRFAGRHPPGVHPSVGEASIHAACLAAEELGAAAIAVFTLSGRTAFLVAAHRPTAPILAFTPNDDTYRRLALAWGVKPVLAEMVGSSDTLVSMAEHSIRRYAGLKAGDLVVLVTGSSIVPGATNVMKICRMGEPVR